VAELIDFAEGRAGNAERRRIEAHVEASSCGYCQSWITKAKDSNSTPASPRIPSSQAESSSTADAPQWQRQALSDLEKRLQQLEDGNLS
jgi:hypothetical protein